MYIWVSSVRSAYRGQNRVTGCRILGTGIAVFSHHVGAGNGILALWKTSSALDC